MLESNLTIRGELTEVGRAREWISELANQASISSQVRYELQLAVSEACTNAIKHAYGMASGHDIELSAKIDGEEIRLVIRDYGTKLDLEAYKEPDPEDPSEGGYGIYILRSLMDEVHFDVSHDQGTEVTLIKQRSKGDIDRPTS